MILKISMCDSPEMKCMCCEMNSFKSCNCEKIETLSRLTCFFPWGRFHEVELCKKSYRVVTTKLDAFESK